MNYRLRLLESLFLLKMINFSLKNTFTPLKQLQSFTFKGLVSNHSQGRLPKFDTNFNNSQRHYTNLTNHCNVASLYDQYSITRHTPKWLIYQWLRKRLQNHSIFYLINVATIFIGLSACIRSVREYVLSVSRTEVALSWNTSLLCTNHNLLLPRTCREVLESCLEDAPDFHHLHFEHAHKFVTVKSSHTIPATGRLLEAISIIGCTSTGVDREQFQGPGSRSFEGICPTNGGPTQPIFRPSCANTDCAPSPL
jgi:hypothetical protein